MKRRLQTSLAAAFFLLAAVHSPAQGTVDFLSNLSPTLGITSNVITGATAEITPGHFVFGLYFATTTNALAGPINPVLLVTNSGFPGAISANTTITLDGFARGATFLFEVKGWSMSEGGFGFPPTFEDAETESTYFGVSAIGEVTLGGGINLPGQIFGSTGGAVASPILINEVPEPSTLIAGGLGAAMIVAGRRKW